jgi:signal transduction histidine kinase
MDQINDIFQLRDLVPYPLFTVKNDTVQEVNKHAAGLLIAPGMQVEDMLLHGDAYGQLAENATMAVELCQEGYRLRGTVTRRKGLDLFLLEPDNTEAAQQMLCTVSSALRMPLQHIFGGIQNINYLLKPEDPELQKYLGQITKGAFEALRMVANMSDVTYYSQAPNELNALDLTQELGEVTRKAAGLLEQVGITVTFTSSLPDQIRMANRQTLERALHNLILSAATYRSRTEKPWIRVELKEAKDQIHLVVTDNGQGIRDDVFANLFTRYLRQPNWEDRGFGIGQGLPLVQAIAKNHGGTVLVERLSPSGTRVTMTIQAVAYDAGLVSTTRFPRDYSSEFDHAFTELGSLLPGEAFPKT